jgi:hypothetical protein
MVKAIERYGQPVSPLIKRIAIIPSWQNLLDRIGVWYQRQALLDCLAA